jgi:chorismate dehydratase
VAKKKIDAKFLSLFNEANRSGIESIELVSSLWNFPEYSLDNYFNKNISYTLNLKKHQGMNHFLELLG